MKAVGRGRAAREEARRRKTKRLEEELRMADVWERKPTARGESNERGKRTQDQKGSPPGTAIGMEPSKDSGGRPGEDDSRENQQQQQKEHRQRKQQQRQQKQSEASAIRIQAAIRGGQARSESRRRQVGREEREAEETLRAQEKVW